MKSLVVVESPTKAKTIEKYLGKEFFVKASVGHIKDLPKGKLGVDLKNDFEPTYEVIPEKKKVIEELRKAAEKAGQIYLALDPDREGEAIAWHVSEEILKGAKKKTAKPIHRILFHEITRKAVQEAIKNPQKLDRHLYEAQQARRVLDRIVGYQISPLLWDKVRRGLSAGRVQSVATRLICDREREIKAFRPEEYWTLEFELEGSVAPSFRARVVTEKGEKLKIPDEGTAKKVIQAVESASCRLNSIQRKERRRTPPPPFITSKLQQAAAQRLGFTAKRTMVVAQQLYEGVEVGEEGLVGLITYMRTDSTRLANDAVQEARDYIFKRFGRESLPDGPIFYKNKKSVQDAHEAIRPTAVTLEPDQIRDSLTEDQYKVYSLIWSRFVACQMTPALYDQTTFEISSGDYGLRAIGSRLRFPGYLAVYGVEADETVADEEEAEGLLPDLAEGEILKILKSLPDQHFTEPPPRFNEASLIKELEEKGIGRPSTYASIISTIQDREYVRKAEAKFAPTDLGFIVTDLLVESFPNILNVEFTARMEEELDEVEEGRRGYAEAVKDFYKPFHETLTHAKVKMRNVKRQEIPTDLSCEKCGNPMVIKWGRRGEFLACTNYPACKNTREFERDDDGAIRLMKKEVTGEFCASCGGQMIIKSGRFGKFLACSNYPTCKTTRPIATGINCPKCGGRVVERRTRKGRTFYGCGNYPHCKFASWDKPLKETCPQCGSPYLVQKQSKKLGVVIRCPAEDCGFSKAGAA